MNEFEGSPKTWPPLGLPTGSVRALLTLIVVAVVVTKLALDRPPDALWVETLMIALAHYFTSRRFVALPPAVMQRLEQEGVLEKERQPLYLPKSSIRTIIIGAFVGLGIYLFRGDGPWYERRLFQPQALAMLSMVFAYLFGAIVGSISGWFKRHQPRPITGAWGDIKAVIVLGAIIVAAVPEFVDVGIRFPPSVDRVALGLALFYFGSR
jgi:magnesium-transporting ATPase (P-type)